MFGHFTNKKTIVKLPREIHLNTTVAQHYKTNRVRELRKSIVKNK